MPIGLTDAGLFWHTDGAYLDEPPLASIIRAIEVPMRDGRPLGDTEFASMSAAYDALDAETREIERRIGEGICAKYNERNRDRALRVLIKF